MIFCYANHFASLGHDVNILIAPPTYFKRMEGLLPYWLRKSIVKLKMNNGVDWFKLDKKVKLKFLDLLDDSTVHDGHAIFATAVGTAMPVSRLSVSKGRKFYLIQDFENWHLDDENVKLTYKLGLHNIVVSKWLKEIVDENSFKKSTLILNPINTEIFKITNKIEERHPHSIAMIRQTDERKGFKYGLRAINRIKELYPDTQCTIFSIYERSEEIPSWIRYVRNADEQQLVSIYNSSAVFLCSSIQEGYGLCGAESMACGCALVSTNYQGVFSYSTPQEDVLLSEVRDVDGLVKNIKKLFDNVDYRISMGYKGHHNVQKTSWQEACRIIDAIVLQ